VAPTCRPTTTRLRSPRGTLVLAYYDDRNNVLDDGVATTVIPDLPPR
jgi:hypothetical protein